MSRTLSRTCPVHVPSKNCPSLQSILSKQQLMGNNLYWKSCDFNVPMSRTLLKSLDVSWTVSSMDMYRPYDNTAGRREFKIKKELTRVFSHQVSIYSGGQKYCITEMRNVKWRSFVIQWLWCHNYNLVNLSYLILSI